MDHIPLRKKLLEFVRYKGGNVSFVEFQNEFPEIKGNEDFGQPSFNLLFWPNVTIEFIETMNFLIKEDKLKFSPCESLVYTIDGVYFNFPVAKDFKRYESLRWYPMVFSLL